MTARKKSGKSKRIANQTGVTARKTNRPGPEFSTEPVFSGSAITAERVYLHKMSRFQPIRRLKPEILSRQLDDFHAGYLRECAMTFEAIANRDDILSTVIPKRTCAPARHGWQVIIQPGLDESRKAEAMEHKRTLEYFYNNLTCTSAMELDVRRGSSLLIEQMMSCVGMKYAVHETIFQPTLDPTTGEWMLTAAFVHVPLYWFENWTGRLRYLPTDLSYFGDELEENAWMITVGRGLMEASAVAYMYKTLLVRDWMLYSEKHAMPGIHGKTKGQKGSAQWDNMVDAVEKIARDFAVVTNLEEEIEKIDFSTDGQLPYEPGILLMNKVMSAMWRGADLSTLSAGGKDMGQGASIQADEGAILEQSDCAMLSETLNERVDKFVIYWKFGPGVKPLAYLKITPPEHKETYPEIALDRFLVESGAPLGVEETMERYGRTMPAEGDAVLKPIQTRSFPFGQSKGTGNGNGADEVDEDEPIEAANEDPVQRKLAQSASKAGLKVEADELQGLRKRLEDISLQRTPEAMANALRRLKEDLPDMLKEMNKKPKLAGKLFEALSAAMFNGAAEIEAARKKRPAMTRKSREALTFAGG